MDNSKIYWKTVHLCWTLRESKSEHIQHWKAFFLLTKSFRTFTDINTYTHSLTHIHKTSKREFKLRQINA